MAQTDDWLHEALSTWLTTDDFEQFSSAIRKHLAEAEIAAYRQGSADTYKNLVALQQRQPEGE